MEKLAISIPTFKRPNLLRENLLKLAPQCLANGVTLYIFDDSMSDTNEYVYKEIMSDYPCLCITRNQRNLGIDENIEQCFSVPTAEYVWVIGEDDIVAERAVKTVLDALRSEPEYLFLNYQYISNDYSNFLNVALQQQACGTVEAGAFFSKNGWATGFIGANIVRKINWIQGGNEFIGTYFNHVGKIFFNLTPKTVILILSKPVIYNRAENLNSFTWVKDFFEVHAGFSKMIKTLGLKAPEWQSDAEGCLAGFTSKMNYKEIKTVIVLRALGVYNWGKYKKYFCKLPNSVIYAVIALVPVEFLKPIYKVYQTLKKSRNGKVEA